MVLIATTEEERGSQQCHAGKAISIRDYPHATVARVHQKNCVCTLKTMKKGLQAFVRYPSRLELVNQTQSYDVISVDASVTSELVVVQQVDFVVNIGGHVLLK